MWPAMALPSSDIASMAASASSGSLMSSASASSRGVVAGLLDVACGDVILEGDAVAIDAPRRRVANILLLM